MKQAARCRVEAAENELLQALGISLLLCHSGVTAAQTAAASMVTYGVPVISRVAEHPCVRCLGALNPSAVLLPSLAEIGYSVNRDNSK